MCEQPNGIMRENFFGGHVDVTASAHVGDQALAPTRPSLATSGAKNDRLAIVVELDLRVREKAGLSLMAAGIVTCPLLVMRMVQGLRRSIT
jgi:hypothetical protein